MHIKDALHAAIAAENAPEGYILTDSEKALEVWDEQGGHLLWLRNGNESVYFVALEDTPITSSVQATITEVMPVPVSYDRHPAATQTVDVDSFRSMMEGN